MELFNQSSQGLILRRRAIDQGNQGAIPATVENFPKSNLERAELSQLGGSVYDEIPSATVNDGAEALGISPRNYEDELAVVG
jgi:hypothetical protein